MTIQEIAETVIRGEVLIKFPLKREYGGDIYDDNGNHVLDIRGWGRMQYHPKGEEVAAGIQDALADWVVTTLNDAYKAQRII